MQCCLLYVGWLSDITASYDVAFYGAGVTMFLSGLMLFLAPYIGRIQTGDRAPDALDAHDCCCIVDWPYSQSVLIQNFWRGRYPRNFHEGAQAQSRVPSIRQCWRMLGLLLVRRRSQNPRTSILGQKCVSCVTGILVITNDHILTLTYSQQILQKLSLSVCFICI